MSGLWLAKWPNGDIIFAQADCEEEILAILDEEADPGNAIIQEYDGPPFALEFRAKLPGRYTNSYEFLRPSGAPPAADDLRRALWAQCQAGQLTDLTLCAWDGSKRRTHRAVVAAACPTLRPQLLSGGAEEVSVPGALSGAALEAVLQWLYIQELDPQVPAREVLPAAVALKLEQLAEACDYQLSRESNTVRYSVQEDEEQENAHLSRLLGLLSFADTHGRQRLVRHTLQQVPQGRWGRLRARPEFAALPPALQAAVKLAANKDEPFILRWFGALTSFGVAAGAYRDAGGRLSPDEETLLADYEEARAALAAAQDEAAAAARRRRGRGGAAAAAPPFAEGAAAAAAAEMLTEYEVNLKDVEGSVGLFGDDCSAYVDYELAPDSALEASMDFFAEVTKFAHPAIAAEIELRREVRASLQEDEDSGDERDSQGRLTRLSRADRRMVAAIQADCGRGREEERVSDARKAQLVLAAERGDRNAFAMLSMGVSVPGVFP